jgi:hypothetical protein
MLRSPDRLVGKIEPPVEVTKLVFSAFERGQ